MTHPGLTALPLVLALALGAPGPARAADTFDINVILPLTGGGAFVGNGHRESLSTLAEVVNKEGGIRGKPVRFVLHDDQTNPQVAVQLATDILAEKPAVILGSGLVAMCRAIAPLMKDGRSSTASRRRSIPSPAASSSRHRAPPTISRSRS
jgi:branched-chain amino acid transport system substrate-binding protein